MSGQMVAFFLLSLCTIGGAVFMISFTKVVHMVVSLAFTFLSIAGIYILLQAEFVAITQVLVYVGAVTILMLFGIMLTKHQDLEAEKPFAKKIVTLIIVAAFFVFVFISLQSAPWSSIAESQNYTQNNTLLIGTEMFTKYVIPFELVSVLLLVALVGAIILAKREESDK